MYVAIHRRSSQRTFDNHDYFFISIYNDFLYEYVVCKYLLLFVERDENHEFRSCRLNREDELP